MVTVTGMELSGGSRGAGEKLCQEGGGHGTVTQGCGHGPELPELTVLGVALLGIGFGLWVVLCRSSWAPWGSGQEQQSHNSLGETWWALWIIGGEILIVVVLNAYCRG